MQLSCQSACGALSCFLIRCPKESSVDSSSRSLEGIKGLVAPLKRDGQPPPQNKVGKVRGVDP